MFLPMTDIKSLKEITTQIQEVGEEQRRLKTIICSREKLPIEKRVKLTIRHDSLIDLKIDLINKFYRLSNQSLRVQSFN